CERTEYPCLRTCSESRSGGWQRRWTVRAKGYWRTKKLHHRKLSSRSPSSLRRKARRRVKSSRCCKTRSGTAEDVKARRLLRSSMQAVVEYKVCKEERRHDQDWRSFRSGTLPPLRQSENLGQMDRSLSAGKCGGSYSSRSRQAHFGYLCL